MFASSAARLRVEILLEIRVLIDVAHEARHELLLEWLHELVDGRHARNDYGRVCGACGEGGFGRGTAQDGSGRGPKEGATSGRADVVDCLGLHTPAGSVRHSLAVRGWRRGRRRRRRRRVVGWRRRRGRRERSTAAGRSDAPVGQTPVGQTRSEEARQPSSVCPSSQNRRAVRV